MAGVYEIKLVSHWVNFNPKDLERIIEKAIEKEEKERANKKYNDAIKKVEHEFNTRASEISTKKKKMIRELVSDSKKGPEEISKELARILGVQFVDKK